jgi:hypothetical protein
MKTESHKVGTDEPQAHLDKGRGSFVPLFTGFR